MTRDAAREAKLKRIADAATRGPWKRGGIYHGKMTVTVDRGEVFVADCGPGGNADAEFIATFDPPTVLALLAEIAALRRALASNVETMQEQRRRLDRWGKSSAELDRAIEETENLLPTPPAGGAHG